MMSKKEYDRRQKLREKEEKKKLKEVKPTKKNLKRVAEYLEEVFGWEVFQRKLECQKCGDTTLVTTDYPDTKYCIRDGTKLKKAKDQDLSSLDQLEQALDYAFNYTGTIKKYMDEEFEKDYLK